MTSPNNTQEGSLLVELCIATVLVVVGLVTILTLTVQSTKQRRLDSEIALAFGAVSANLEEIKDLSLAEIRALDGKGFDVPGIGGKAGGLTPVAGDPDNLPGIFIVTEVDGSSQTLYLVRAAVEWRGGHGNQRFEMKSLIAQRKSTTSGGGGPDLEVFNVPVVGSRIVFIVDVSSTMSKPLSVTKVKAPKLPKVKSVKVPKVKSSKLIWTRLDEAKSQLTQIVGDFPEDGMFNFIELQEDVDAFSAVSVVADEDAKAKAADWIGKLVVDDKKEKDIFKALELAFADPEVGTIYLIADGEHMKGDLNPDEMADEVVKWNTTRRVTIHTIAIGKKSDFMQRLAEESGGTYTLIE